MKLHLCHCGRRWLKSDVFAFGSYESSTSKDGVGWTKEHHDALTCWEKNVVVDTVVLKPMTAKDVDEEFMKRVTEVMGYTCNEKFKVESIMEQIELRGARLQQATK